MRPDDDLPPPDAHLRAALRHAPDADAGPPAALSARILADARRAVARPRSLWSWLGRPAGAAAFASVLVAGFVGLLWRGEPPPEALAPAPVAVDERASAVASAPAPGPAAPTAPLPAAPPAQQTAPERAARPAPDAPHELRARAETAEATARALRELPTAAKAAKAGEPAAAARRAGSVADATPAERRPPPDPLAPLLVRLQRDGALPPAWHELQSLTQGHWQPALGGRLPPAGRRIEAADGSLLGWLRWDAEAVEIRPADGGPAWRAPLAPADLARLKSALGP